MANIKTGDTVWLKNGGPSMIVRSLFKNNRFVTCDWFDGNKLFSNAFGIEQLTDEDPSASILPKDD